MQRDQRDRESPSHRRGFYIHQKVVLEVDFSGVIFGYTEITVVPTAKDLATLHLHSKHCVIQHVTVGGARTEAFQWDPTAHLSISNSKDCHIHPELKRRVYSAYAEADEGELSIAIPRESVVSLARSRSQSVAPDGPSVSMGGSEFAPITVRIEYSMHNPPDGVQFIIPSDTHPYRAPHVYTTPSAPDAARCWVPCLDSMADKCTWEFQFVVPRYLEEGAELSEDAASYPTVVVCSGDFGQQITHPSQSGKVIFTFSQSDATSVQQISWAAGPFHVYPVPTEHLDDTAATQPLMHAFCLPGHETQLVSSVTFLRSAMNFFMSDMGSYPFNSYKLVFVEELPTQRFDTSTMSLCTTDLLHGEDAIDQVYETRLFLSHALACQWAGVNIQPKTPSDTWLVNGLGLYMTSCFLRKLFGNNEHRYRLKKDMDRVLEWDNGNMPPICQPHVAEEPEGAVLNFINLKAPLILHILDRRLTKSGTSLGLSRVLPKLFLQAMSGELAGNALGTHAFLRLCRKVSGMDPRSFAEQWIYGSGFPSFQFQASFNRKKMAVEILMRQECPAHALHANDAIGRELFNPVPFFEGQMTIRIHEADGTPYEHVLDIRSPFKRFEVPFNTKYKRVRRNTKRYMARQAAAQAAVDGEETAAVPGPGELVDVGFAVEIWEGERERENWKIAEWTEEDEQRMAGATYEWIRLDVDLEWIAAVAFEQPDFMWVSQLQRDRDVVAQLEAVHALMRQPTAIISSVLVKTALVPKYFYRIRCEAVLALASCAIPKLDYLGLFHLFKLFLRYCYEPEDPRQDLFTHTYVPRSNDFSDIPEYFVRKALINGLSRVRFDNGKTPSIIRQFLADQLRFNDNTSNPYSDAFYICTIVAALAAASVPTKPPERNEISTTEIKAEHTPEDAKLLQAALAEVDRYRSMDRLIPSAHNVVTIASIEFYVVLSMADLIPSDPRTFFPLTREGHYTQVRMAAFDALFLTKWYTPKIMRYFFAVMAHDASRTIRRHVARNACHSLALLFAMGELKAVAKDADALLIEEDGSGAPDRAKEAKKSEVDQMIRAFRKDRELGKSEVLREFLMPLALAQDVDHEVRWYLLKLADMLLRGSEEAPPKPKIYLPPPTPVVEQPPTLAIKVAKREKTRSDSIMSSPLTPSTSGTKLKLSFNAGGTPSQSTAKPLPTPIRATPKPIVPVRTSTPAVITKPPLKPHKLSTRQVPKSQSGGMASTEYKAAKKLLGELVRHKNAPLFLQPVDPIRDKVPNYFDVIQDPMDLSTMGSKLEAGQYKDLASFETDFRLMVANCKYYNADGTYAFNEAVSLDKYFRKEMERVKNTLRKFNERQIAAQPVPPPRESMPPPPPPATTSSRPTIKLSLPSAAKAKDSPRASPAPTASSSSKPKKPKVAVDLPPPPYVDDGSHDLLQEVIAIENEREEKRSTVSIKLNVGKRKRSTPSATDDDETVFVGAAKKERPSPAPSQASSHAEAPPKPKPKLIIVPKAKKPTDSVPASPAATATPVPATPTPAPSRKGKEREVLSSTAASPAPSPAPLKLKPLTSVKPPTSTKPPTNTKPSTNSAKPLAGTATSTPIDSKKCKEIVRSLLRLPEAGIFSRPVDPVLDGCPTYFDEIKRPMDLGTMQTKLSQGRYATMESFAADYHLMIQNCRVFNPPKTFPTDCADALDRVFDKEWAKVHEKRLNFAEKRSLQAVLGKLVADPLSWVFREPVDPVALGIPMYHEIIPKKDARDLRTIRTKLDNDRYDTVDALEADIELMVSNAVKFNGAESEVGQLALQLRSKAREALATVNPTRKRKDGGSTPQPGSKKVKLI